MCPTETPRKLKLDSSKMEWTIFTPHSHPPFWSLLHYPSNSLDGPYSQVSQVQALPDHDVWLVHDTNKKPSFTDESLNSQKPRVYEDEEEEEEAAGDATRNEERQVRASSTEPEKLGKECVLPGKLLSCVCISDPENRPWVPETYFVAISGSIWVLRGEVHWVAEI